MKEGYTLRPYQQRAVDFVRNALAERGNSNREETNSAIIVLPTGCHALGEQVLMADGVIKKVENVCLGDQLCGEDGSPRTVMYIHRGESDLYRIVPEKGKSFVITGNHKITLLDIRTGNVEDIEVERYMSFAEDAKTYFRLIRSKGVDFSNGMSLDQEDAYSKGFNFAQMSNGIPDDYKRGTRNTRLQFLAGMFDQKDIEFHYDKKYFSQIVSSKRQAEDICYMAHSVGLDSFCEEYLHTDLHGYVNGRYKVYIGGNLSVLPCRYRDTKSYNSSTDYVCAKFRIESSGFGKFVGFTVDGNNRYLLSDFTITHNCGKTICFSSIVENELNSGGRVLVLAHRNKLLEQAHDKLLSACDIDASYEGQDGGDNRIVICSIQSMSRDDRLAKYDPNYFSLIIVDETHHIASPSYMKVRNYFEGAKLVGVTATPVRGDGHDTREDFDAVGPEYTTQQAIEDGFLTPVHVKKIPIKIDISDVHLQGGDYAAGEIANVLDKYLKKIAKATATQAQGKKIVVFVPLVATAQKMSEIFKQEGLRAEYVSGDRKDSDEVLNKFEQGEYDVVINSMLLTEGWDCPSVDCVINLRPTRSESLYTQIIGRGLRLSPGKESALVLDFLWQDTGRGQLSVEDVLAKPTDEFEKRAMNKLLETGEEFGLNELKARAKEAAVNEREIALQEAIQRANLEKEMKLREDAARRELFESLEAYAMRVSKEKGVSPFDVYGVIRRGPKKNVKVKYHCMSGDIVAIHIEDKAMEEMGMSMYYAGNGSWEQNLPSIGQIKFATQLGIPQEYLVCAGQASNILSLQNERSKNRLGTYKQLRILTNAGLSNIRDLSAGECARRMKQLFARKNRAERSSSQAHQAFGTQHDDYGRD